MGVLSSYFSTPMGQYMGTAAVICTASYAIYCMCSQLAPPDQGQTHNALPAWPLSPSCKHLSDDAPEDTTTTTTTTTDPSPTKPVSVNYHFTRKCNAECGFCFHTEKTSHVASEADMRRGLALLKAAGMRKVNFAGGEPFLYPSKLAMLVKYCKADLGLESVSIISNGTKVTHKWLQDHGQYVDVMGISCDSFLQKTNAEIGRDVSGTAQDNVEQLFLVRGWCKDLGIKFKLNTVVCRFNWDEDMAAQVEKLDPFRWKCFQVLVVQGENDDQEVLAAAQVTSRSKTDDVEEGEKLQRLHKRKRNAQRFVITDDEFQSFCRRHEHLSCFVPETNELMATSYLILDEYLCFLDKGDGQEKQSSSILEVGVDKALQEVRWDEQAFKARGGFYEWTKDVDEGVGCQAGKAEMLEW